MKPALDEARKAVDEAAVTLQAKQADAARLEQLALRFDNLQRHIGRWNHVVYCSPVANTQVTDVFMRFNCGCCDDSPLEAWPYLKTEHGEVYSNPPCFVVGERHWMSGARPTTHWKAALQQAQIPDAVIRKVQGRFEADRLERMSLAAEDSTSGDDPDPFV